jgi:hypothetical protein
LVTEFIQQMINCDKKSRKIFYKSFGMLLKCTKLHQIICDNAATTKHIKICFICKIKDNKKLGMAKKKVRILLRSLKPPKSGFFRNMFFVYGLYSEAHDRLYIGQTNDLVNRLRRHNSGYEPF